MSEYTHSESRTAAPAEAVRRVEAIEQPNRDRVSWGAIFVGLVTAVALQGLLTLLGAAWGFATIDPTEEVNPLAGLAMGSGVWWFITSIISLFAGGWVAGRTSGLPYTPAATVHGVAVWGLSTIAALWMAASAAQTAASAAASGVSSIASAAGSLASAVTPDGDERASSDDAGALANLADTQIINSLERDVERYLEERDLVAADIRAELREMYRSVISERERRRAGNIAERLAGDIARTPGDFSSDVSTSLDRLFGGENAVLSEEDREELEDALQERFDISDAEAARIAERWERRWLEATERVEQAAAEAVETTEEIAEATVERAASASLGAFFASFFGLLAAAVGAAIARPEGYARHTVA